jgi:hypothetical protein
MIKALKILGIEEMFLNIIKATYDKPILNVENTKTFLLKSETRPGYPLSPLLFNNFGIPSQSNEISKK